MRSKEKIRQRARHPRFKILLSMAAYNGEVHQQTMTSMAMLAAASQNWPFKFEVHMSVNEFITHARNKAANTVLRDKSYQGVFFVDSDMSFTHEDVRTLWGWMMNGYKICGGNYCFKKLDWALIRSAARAGVSAEELPFYASRMNGVPVVGDEGQAHFNNEEVKEVEALGAGLLFIHRSVFEKIADHHADLLVERPGEEPYYEFFQVGKTKLGHYGTEDVFFAHLARTVGERSWWPQSVRPGHVGKHVFQAISSPPRELPVLENLLAKLDSGELTPENMNSYFTPEELKILSPEPLDELQNESTQEQPESEPVNE